MLGRFFCGYNREYLPLNKMVLDKQPSLKLNKTKSNGNMIGSDEQTAGCLNLFPFSTRIFWHQSLMAFVTLSPRKRLPCLSCLWCLFWLELSWLIFVLNK